MGAKISKHYTPTNRSQKFSNFFWIFFLMVGPHKMFGIFEILKNEILMNFIRFR